MYCDISTTSRSKPRRRPPLIACENSRKHRRPVIALATILAVLVLGIAGTTWGLFRARQEEKAAVASEKKAIDEANAKQAALVTASVERDRAERQLANGLLRPIGFSKNSPAESRSFVDWSAIKESPLKLRVLEIAFEDPETALRIARLADYVVQACVGLSPIRREQAIKLVSARQRDHTADPRIRIAACWLALQLGSADLPAWAESCNYLGNPKNKCVDQFGEFVTFAASRSDPQQVAQLNLEPLIPALEKSKDDLVRATPLDALAAMAPRLEPAQAERAWDVLLAILEKSKTRKTVGRAAPPVFGALATRLEPAQAKRAWDTLLATLEKSEAVVPYWSSHCLAVLALRLDRAQVESRRGYPDCDPRQIDGGPRFPPYGLGSIGRAGAAAGTSAGQACVGYAPCDPGEIGGPPVTFAAAATLPALAPRLGPTEVTGAGDGLIAIPGKTEGRPGPFGGVTRD